MNRLDFPFSGKYESIVILKIIIYYHKLISRAIKKLIQ